MKKISKELQSSIELFDLILLQNWEWSSNKEGEKYSLDLSGRLFWLKNELQRKGMWYSGDFKIVINEN